MSPKTTSCARIRIQEMLARADGENDVQKLRKKSLSKG